MGEVSLGDAGPDLPREVLGELLALEGGAVEVALLPLELGGVGVVVSVVVGTEGEAGDEDVLELVQAGEGVGVEEAEGG